MTMIHLDVSSQTEQKAKSVLNSLGLTLDDAVNLLVSKIARENRLPFADKVADKTVEKASVANVKKVEQDDSSDIFKLRGMIKTDIHASIDEINEAIELGASADFIDSIHSAHAINTSNEKIEVHS